VRRALDPGSAEATVTRDETGFICYGAPSLRERRGTWRKSRAGASPARLLRQVPSGARRSYAVANPVALRSESHRRASATPALSRAEGAVRAGDP